MPSSSRDAAASAQVPANDVDHLDFRWLDDLLAAPLPRAPDRSLPIDAATIAAIEAVLAEPLVDAG